MCMCRRNDFTSLQKCLKSSHILRWSGKLLEIFAAESWKVPCSSGIESLMAELERHVRKLVTW